MEPYAPTTPPSPNPTGKATAGMILGIVSMLLWCLPILGLPASIVGLVLSILGTKSTSRGMAIAGLVLSSIALALSLVNAAIGAYLAVTGQNPLLQ